MITCNECIERMKPDDPRVKSGRYHLCGCDYCNKEPYFRELEQIVIPKEIPPSIPNGFKLYNGVQQTKGMLLHLQRKLNEHLDEKGDFL